MSTVPFLLPRPVCEELLPGPVSHGPLGSQVTAVPVCVGGLAGEPNRYDQPTPPLSGPEVATEQVGHPVHPRPTHVGHQADGLTERELDEPGRHLARIDRLEPEACRDRYH